MTSLSNSNQFIHMKNHFNFRIVLNIFLISLVLYGCEKSKNKEYKFPTTPDEIEESIRISQHIAKESSVILESAISKASKQDGIVNPTEIARTIESIEDVLSATPNSTGTGIIIAHKDKTFSNIPIFAKDDERLFKVIGKKSSKGFYDSTKSISPLPFMPNGDGKALILAPFQDSFNTDLFKISQQLQSAGYRVDQFINEDANLERFRGTFLTKYDVVYISTHGLADLYTWAGTKSTLLLTRSLNDANSLTSVLIEERNTLAACTINGIEYIAISAPWLYTTSIGDHFKNSWVFADACESSKVNNGPTSLSQAFFDLGAGGYNGYKVPIEVSIANNIASTMFDKYSSGVSIIEASDMVRNDPTLKAITWTIGIGDLISSYSVTSFDEYHFINNPLYLFKLIPYGEVSDIDGNTYKTVQIGLQTWLAENLKTRKYNDGTVIPNEIDYTKWIGLTTGAYCDFKNNPENSETYGRLYNWYVVAPTNSKNVCPTGWHVPSDAEWKIMEDYLVANGYDFDPTNGNNKIAKSLAALTNWSSSDLRGAVGNTDYHPYRNCTGFTALPGGRREQGVFDFLGYEVFWWSTTEQYGSGAWSRMMWAHNAFLNRTGGFKYSGYSVRCVKD